MADRNFDVVIIGSGAGGGAAAWALARRGVKVLLLEAGPAYDPHKDYRLHTDSWEKTGFPAKIAIRGRQSYAPLQALDNRWRNLRSWNHLTGPMNRTDRRQVWGYEYAIALGGSTLRYTGEAHRLHPGAMTMKSRFGVAADWPFDYAELEPWYVLAEQTIGVAGPARDRVRWRSAPFPLPPHPLSFASQKIAAGCRALGLSYVPNARAALSRPYDGRPSCNYCGNCSRGCPLTDKGSVDVTFIVKARKTGRCTIRTGVRVTRLRSGANDRITGIQYEEAGGKTGLVEAPAVIVACGAVETPRLLLASANRHAPDGIANESGEVGRNFMETLAWVSSGLHAEPLGSYRGLPADSICWDFNAPDAIPGVVGGCRFTPMTATANLNGPINHAARVVGGWGRDHKDRMRSTFGRVLSVGGIGENLPNPRSFVGLDPVQRDSGGMPLARIHSHLNDGELKRLAFMAKMSRDILKASGVLTIFEEYGTYDAFLSTHVFGTCRMGIDAAKSVVDPFCRSHRWRNLYIADASVFPSSGGGEGPSLTISALAIRAATHMAEKARRGEL